MTERTHDKVEVVWLEDPGVASHPHHLEGVALLHYIAVLLILLPVLVTEKKESDHRDRRLKRPSYLIVTLSKLALTLTLEP